MSLAANHTQTVGAVSESAVDSGSESSVNTHAGQVYQREMILQSRTWSQRNSTAFPDLIITLTEHSMVNQEGQAESVVFGT